MRPRHPTQRLEARHDGLLHHGEHVFAIDEGHLQVELTEFELTVCAQILVAPTRRDLVIPVEPANHAELLEELRRLGECEEAARLETHRYEEVACTLRRPLRHRWCPDVHEVELVHRIPDRLDHRMTQAQVPLHALTAHVEPAIAEAE